jgi:DNA adenine methylase
MLKHILKIMPPHRIYVEVFGGSGKVLLNKKPSEIEVWNDFDRKIANLFHVVAFKFEEFYEKTRFLVYSRELYKTYLKELKGTGMIELGDVDMAVKMYYVLSGTFGGGGSGFKYSGFAFSRRENEARRYWNRLEKLEQIRERLAGVLIECDDFEKVIRRWDSEETLFYLDPPYFGVETYYEGFSVEDHKRLLSLLKEIKGKWLLSGYANELYDRELASFNRFEFVSIKHSYYKPGCKERVTRPRVKEVLWCNYEITDTIDAKRGLEIEDLEIEDLEIEDLETAGGRARVLRVEDLEKKVLETEGRDGRQFKNLCLFDMVSLNNKRA